MDYEMAFLSTSYGDYLAIVWLSKLPSLEQLEAAEVGAIFIFRVNCAVFLLTIARPCKRNRNPSGCRADESKKMVDNKIQRSCPIKLNLFEQPAIYKEPASPRTSELDHKSLRDADL